MSRKGIKLTAAGRCVNPECRAPLYKELMVCRDDQLCFDEWPSEGG